MVFGSIVPPVSWRAMVSIILVTFSAGMFLVDTTVSTALVSSVGLSSGSRVEA